MKLEKIRSNLTFKTCLIRLKYLITYSNLAMASKV